jgi:hypothetical protein
MTNDNINRLIQESINEFLNESTCNQCGGTLIESTCNCMSEGEDENTLSLLQLFVDPSPDRATDYGTLDRYQAMLAKKIIDSPTASEDIKNLLQLWLNPDPSTANKHYGSVKRYKQMLVQKISRGIKEDPNHPGAKIDPREPSPFGHTELSDMGIYDDLYEWNKNTQTVKRIVEKYQLDTKTKKKLIKELMKRKQK